MAPAANPTPLRRVRVRESRSHVTGLMSTPPRQFSPTQGIRRNRTAFANWVPTSAALPMLPLMKSINGARQDDVEDHAIEEDDRQSLVAQPTGAEAGVDDPS